MSNVLISGSIAYDHIMDFPDYFKNHILADKIHNLNVSFLINGFKVNKGGTAGNIAYNLCLLGEKSKIIASAGKDFSEYRKWLEEIGIDCSGVKVIEDELTASANIITDRGDNQITAFYPGSMKYPAGLKEEAILKNTLAIVSPGNMEDMVEFPILYKKKKTPYIFDPGQQITALTAEQLRESIKGAKAFISNDYELCLVTMKTGWSEKNITDQVETLVTTLGEKGSLIRKGGTTIEIPPAKVNKAVDPTGAGDAYRAGFIKGLIAGFPIEKTGKLASAVAAYAVENYGTQNHTFTWEDIKKRYAENFGEEII